MSWMQEQMVTVQNCFFLFHKPLAADEKKSSNPLPIYSVIVHFFRFFDSSISTKKLVSASTLYSRRRRRLAPPSSPPKKMMRTLQTPADEAS